MVQFVIIGDRSSSLLRRAHLRMLYILILDSDVSKLKRLWVSSR